MAICFGHRWTSNYGEALNADKNLTEAANIWLNGLNDLSTDQIKAGLDQMLKDGEEWPPSMPQFVKMCKNDNDDWRHKGAAYVEVDPRKLIRHKCDPEKANSALEEMKKLVGSKSAPE